MYIMNPMNECSSAQTGRTLDQSQPACLRLCRQTGFTLIELLVVISVISLLIAILMPALAASRKSGNRIKCMSTVRQIGLGFGMYTTDFKDSYPITAIGAVTQPYTWVYFLMDGQYVPNIKTFYSCPEMPQTYSTFMDTAVRYTHYGYNFRGIGTDWFTTGALSGAPARNVDIKKSTHTLLMGDVADVTNHKRGRYSLANERIATGAWGEVDARHNRSANMLWVDGHASGPYVQVPEHVTQYTSTNNPYMHDPYRFGTIAGHENNHFDRQ
jgi:prepilin-type N-terminal cleavage/methylation domain-containing protein/prepilin-type processing-associated H-X9-DG protein